MISTNTPNNFERDHPKWTVVHQHELTDSKWKSVVYEFFDDKLIADRYYQKYEQEGTAIVILTIRDFCLVVKEQILTLFKIVAIAEVEYELVMHLTFGGPEDYNSFGLFPSRDAVIAFYRSQLVEQPYEEEKFDPFSGTYKKQKGSKNRNKARQRLARAYERISNLRSNTLHVFTTSLIREHQAIGIEDLNVKGMMQNRKLAKHIGDASWGEISRQLRYKAVASQHCTLVIADPFYPSTQTCSCCNKKPVQRLKLYERRWTCLYCGSEHHRDINAAENLKQLAIREHVRKTDPTTRIVLTCR